MPTLGEEIKVFSPDGDPRKKSTTLSSALIVQNGFKLEPILLTGHLSVEPLNETERKTLAEKLGAPINAAACLKIQSANYRVIASLALSSRLPDWKAFGNRLSEIISIGNTCLDSARSFVKLTHKSSREKDLRSGVLSVDQVVKMYLSRAGKRSELVVDIQNILKACQECLTEIEPLASKKGPKGDIVLRSYLETLTLAAESTGGRITLPSNDVKDPAGSKRTTRFVEFVLEAIKLVADKGNRSLAAADLSVDERGRAQFLLRSFRNKSAGAIVDQLRKVKSRAGKGISRDLKVNSSP